MYLKHLLKKTTLKEIGCKNLATDALFPFQSYLRKTFSCVQGLPSKILGVTTREITTWILLLSVWNQTRKNYFLSFSFFNKYFQKKIFKLLASLLWFLFSSPLEYPWSTTKKTNLKSNPTSSCHRVPRLLLPPSLELKAGFEYLQKKNNQIWRRFHLASEGA